jgi:hypothetical protein
VAFQPAKVDFAVGANPLEHNARDAHGPASRRLRPHGSCLPGLPGRQGQRGEQA